MSRGNGSWIAFLAGGLIGAGVALLFAPKSGKETREQLATMAKGIEGKFKTQFSEIKENAENEYIKMKDKTKNVIEKGKKIYKEEFQTRESDDAEEA